MNTPKVFFITGVSSGFGRAIAESAMTAGHRVVGTVRNEQARKAFEELAPGHAFGRLLEVTQAGAPASVVDEVEAAVGGIDVLVNNAGYGHEGAIEESTLDDLLRQLDVNLFGAVAVLQAVLPHMRRRRAGRIVNITSMGGFITLPGLGFYHASKFALEAISETLGKEVAHLGIHVTAVEPGAFRTEWAGRSMVRTPRSIADYDAVIDPWRERRQGYSGRQPGDPAKAAAAILQLVESDAPPSHLLLGNDAVERVREKLALLESELFAWESVSRSTDFQ